MQGRKARAQDKAFAREGMGKTSSTAAGKAVKSAKTSRSLAAAKKLPGKFGRTALAIGVAAGLYENNKAARRKKSDEAAKKVKK